MGRIYYIMGKSATGKDTVYQELKKILPALKSMVMYTTRPIREGETDGVEYHFSSVEELKRLREAGKVIEVRTYETVLGPWSYFTVDDGQFEKAGKADFLMIGTLESYEKMCAHFGKESMVPVYIEVPDGLRLMRAVEREEQQKNPNYREVCRRYLADEEDFSEEKLKKLGISRRFENRRLKDCLEEIAKEFHLW